MPKFKRKPSAQSVEARRERIRAILARTAEGRAKIDAIIEGTSNDVLPLDDIVDAYILRAIELCGGNISKAARGLRIERSTLQRKLRNRGLRDRLAMEG